MKNNFNSLKSCQVTSSTKIKIIRMLIGAIIALAAIAALNYFFPVLSAVLITLVLLEGVLRMDADAFAKRCLMTLLNENLGADIDISHKVTLENGVMENSVYVVLKEKTTKAEESQQSK